MRVIYIRNYKNKLIFIGLFVVLWVTLMLASGFLMNNTLALKITINNYMAFSYPLNIQVDNVYFNHQLSDTAIQTNSTFNKPIAQEFLNYKSFMGKFSFQYPSAFSINEKDFGGSDILYHIDFTNKSSNSNGFVQVWNLPYPLKEFLDKSKSASNLNYKIFESKAITVNNLPGYSWDYIIVTKDGKSYKALEVFFKKDDKMYRISYFVPENLWNNSQSTVFWNIVNSFKTYQPLYIYIYPIYEV